MTRPFVIFAMPRSRSTWLGALLTYREFVCLHDISAAFQSTADITTVLSRPHTGMCDTQAAFLWPDIVEASPSAKLVTLRRPRGEIMESFKKLGGVDLDRVAYNLDRLELAFNEIEELTGVLKVTYKDLGTEAGCRRVFEHCLTYPFDKRWWKALRNLNIQVDLEVAHAQVKQNQKGIATTFRSAIHYYDGLMRKQA